MALINCGDCGHEVSDLAESCPKCGRPIADKKPSDDGWKSPLVNCGGCGEEVSGLAESCPKCGYPIKGKPAASGGVGCGTWFVGGIFLLVMMAVIGSFNKPENVSTTPTAYGVSDALEQCQYAMKRLSRDPEKADVPYVAGLNTVNQYQFTWDGSTRLMRMRNGLGLEVGTPGYCAVDKYSKKIVELRFDDQKLI